MNDVFHITKQLFQFKEKTGKDITRTEIEGCLYSPPLAIRLEMIKRIQSSILEYNSFDGFSKLKKVCVKKLKEKNNVHSLKEKDIIITNDTSIAFYSCIHSIINYVRRKKKKNKIKIVTHSHVPIEIEKNLFFLSPGKNFEDYSIIRKTNFTKSNLKGADILIFCSPQNPTGRIFEKKEVEKIVEICKSEEVILICDQTYEDIIFSERERKNHIIPMSLNDENDNIISIFSAENSFAMNGFGLSYVVAKNEEIRKNIKQILFPMVSNPSIISQWGTFDALTNVDPFFVSKILKETKEKRNILFQILNESPFFEPQRSHGTFYLWVHINQEGFKEKQGDGINIANALINKHGIGCVPGIYFGEAGKKYLRFSFGCNLSDIKRASETILNLKQKDLL